MIRKSVLFFTVLLVAGIAGILSFPSLYTPPAMKSLLAEAASLPPVEGEVFTDIPYKKRFFRKDLGLDLYMPLESSAHGDIPVLVYIHGGSWLHGDKSTIRIVDPFLKAIRESGIALVAVDYTAGPSGGLKSPLENCQDALLWVRDHGDEYGLDIRNLGLYGVSAGAHLAMMCIPFINEDPQLELRYLLEEFGPVDLKAMAGGDAFDASFVFRLFPESLLERYSPLEYVNGDWPPVLMFHGTADDTVSIRQSEMLDRRLSEAGVPHVYRIVPGGDHGFFNKSRETWRVLEGECLDFLLPLVSEKEKA